METTVRIFLGMHKLITRIILATLIIISSNESFAQYKTKYFIKTDAVIEKGEYAEAEKLITKKYRDKLGMEEIDYLIAKLYTKIAYATLTGSYKSTVTVHEALNKARNNLKKLPVGDYDGKQRLYEMSLIYKGLIELHIQNKTYDIANRYIEEARKLYNWQHYGKWYEKERDKNYENFMAYLKTIEDQLK